MAKTQRKKGVEAEPRYTPHHDPVLDHLVRQFRIRWKLTGANQVAMAKYIGRNQAQLSKFLRGGAGLGGLRLYERLANFFDTTLSDLLSDYPAPPTEPWLLKLRAVYFALPPARRVDWAQNCLRLAGVAPEAVEAADIPPAQTSPRTARTPKTTP